jgi:hypothetical protein
MNVWQELTTRDRGRLLINFWFTVYITEDESRSGFGEAIMSLNDRVAATVFGFVGVSTLIALLLTSSVKHEKSVHKAAIEAGRRSESFDDRLKAFDVQQRTR